MITELYTSPNIELTEIITEPIIHEMNTNSRSVAGLGKIQNVEVEIYQAQIYQKFRIQFRYHKSAHEYFNDSLKNNEFVHTHTHTQTHTHIHTHTHFAIDFGFKKI